MSTSAAQLAALRDEELLVLIAQGDAEALGALYDRYSRLVFTLALRITGDRPTADVVTQDVFQFLWQHAGSFSLIAGLVEGWLVESTRHRAIAVVRAHHKQAYQRGPSISKTPRGTPSDDCHGEQQGVYQDDVRSAFDVLPPTQRQTIELAYYDGLSCTEIASWLGVPVRIVKTNMWLSLTQLRRALLPRLEGDHHQ